MPSQRSENSYKNKNVTKSGMGSGFTVSAHKQKRGSFFSHSSFFYAVDHHIIVKPDVELEETTDVGLIVS